ncbi:hypothetical protein GCM10010387_10120 [Streptomyces inusitatus]|uniref:Uncharacterized protein n=1 Tax=Streptomyces inusitatus TaxID=68221 RepID=A0A918PQ85_9ACTN|nr:hypothetical protein [Streptomyces inusitatus]GGZ19356.1 hypothetical protein GCM10010387_10120 [Streptomyces inusitatus]
MSSPERPGAGRARRRIVHGFLPGRLIAGVSALTAALLYAGDAGGAWHTPWFVAVPLVLTGMLLAGVAGFAHYARRRRRSAIRASTESAEAPASASGSQAIR